MTNNKQNFLVKNSKKCFFYPIFGADACSAQKEHFEVHFHTSLSSKLSWTFLREILCFVKKVQCIRKRQEVKECVLQKLNNVYKLF